MVDGTLTAPDDGYEFAKKLAQSGKRVLLVSGRRYQLVPGMLYLDKDDYDTSKLRKLVAQMLS